MPRVLRPWRRPRPARTWRRSRRSGEGCRTVRIAVATLGLSVAIASAVAGNASVPPTAFQLVGAGTGSGGLSGDTIWSAVWWEGSPKGPGPFLGGPAGAEEICIWHDLGPALADLDDGLGESGLPLSFWRQPDGGGHPGIWGVNAWAARLLMHGTGSDHFDLVACPDAAQVPPPAADVEAALPEGHPPTGRPLHLWIFWDTVPDPPPGHLPGLIHHARAENHLPRLAIETSPSEVGGVVDATVVNLETWLWVDPAGWHRYSATAKGGGDVATVWAIPLTVRWQASWNFPLPTDDPEGGTTSGDEVLDQRCVGPGVPYRATEPAQRTDCGFDFSQPSFGDYEPLQASVEWVAFWAWSDRAGVVGGEGSFGSVEIVSERPLRVMQVESVIGRA